MGFGDGVEVFMAPAAAEEKNKNSHVHTGELESGRTEIRFGASSGGPLDEDCPRNPKKLVTSSKGHAKHQISTKGNTSFFRALCGLN